MKSFLLRALPFLALPLLGHAAPKPDDAEILAGKVPHQAYSEATSGVVLKRGGVLWWIPLWTVDPATLEIVKVLGGSAPAPYAIKITPSGHNTIDTDLSPSRLTSIHLLAGSLKDAVAIRRGLITEIAEMQRVLEKRQGNQPGFLKHLAEAKRP